MPTSVGFHGKIFGSMLLKRGAIKSRRNLEHAKVGRAHLIFQ